MIITQNLLKEKLLNTLYLQMFFPISILKILSILFEAQPLLLRNCLALLSPILFQESNVYKSAELNNIN